jgi:phosphate transport system protein
MIERSHTIKQYDHRLRLLKDMLLLMGYHAEQMIADSIRALVERKPHIADEVILRDDTLDRLELDVDRLCNEILALHHPVARDLRFVMTSFKIVRDIERIGDIAVNMAKRTNELLQEAQLRRLVALPMMGEQAQRILARSLDAFVNSDDKLAEEVVRDDRLIDDLHEQIFRELLTYMMENVDNVARALKLMFIAKHLERVGDHATNIAEMVVFMIRGQDVRRSVYPLSTSEGETPPSPPNV